MNVSVLLRLVPEALADGRLAGSLQVIDTGEQVVIQSTEELVSYLREHCVPRSDCRNRSSGE